LAGQKAAGTVATESLNEAERKILRTRKPKPTDKLKSPDPISLGEGMRAKLLEKLELLTRSMPLDDLTLVVNLARVVRRRSISNDGT
jgi:hypothetical protein